MAGREVKTVCVIGAGTMGGGIAAHLANLGFQVSLLDVDQEAAINGLDRARNARPPLFYVPDRASEIRVGNVSEHLHWVRDADWVCEAIAERLDAKQSLYVQLEGFLGPDALITTNTSGLQIQLLSHGLSDSFRSRFFGAHFFNPPRYLKLVELIPCEANSASFLKEVTSTLELQVARRVVPAKDTPGFIANRFGLWCLFHAIRVAEELHLAVEDVDAITGPFLGRPKSGTFRLSDLIGIDVMRDIGSNLLDRCPQDPRIKTFEVPRSMFNLLARGWLGEKFGHGYYRREGREVFSLDLTTLAYRVHREPTLPAIASLQSLPFGERVRRALQDRSEVGEFLRKYLPAALRYADEIKSEVSHSVVDIDHVMQWGFGWELGPFAAIDAIGAEAVGIDGAKPLYKESKFLSFSGKYSKLPDPEEFRPLASYPEIDRGETYSLRDLGDGITALALTTKMGIIGPPVVRELSALLSGTLSRFVFTSEARSFSAGFDLKFFLGRIQAEDYDAITQALRDLQCLGELLENRACVAAIFGHCLGAGLELALSCPVMFAGAETQIGLPESRVGLIPGGRGVALTRLNNAHTAKRLTEATMTLTEGTVASNPDLARRFGYLRPADITIYNPDRLIWAAKQAAKTVSVSPRPAWTATVGPLAAMIDRDLGDRRARGEISEYDEMIGGRIRQIMARSTGYEDALARERAEFIDLCSRAPTQARIRHMIETGRPLRN